jgi:hypothetical protein
MARTLLSAVLRELQSRLGILHVLTLDEHCLVLQPREAEGSFISIAVEDPARPTYSVTYEALSPAAMSATEAQTQSSVVLLQGLQWIVESVQEHGYVIPEFPHPKLVKALQNSGRASLSHRRRNRPAR